MSAELIGILSVGVALGGLGWRVADRLDRKIGKLADSHHELAREVAGLRGEMRAYFRHEPVAGD